jgi:hypothetical protein
MSRDSIVTPRRRPAVVAVLSWFAILATPSVAGAALAITVPASVNLGAAPTGSATLSGQLGTVTVTASGLVVPSFTATVSSSNFTTGDRTAAETVPKSAISYWSGPATASTGAQAAVPGQLTVLEARALSIPRTAFTSTGLVLSFSTSWNPSIVVKIPAAAVAGSYTGTITHSVA